MRKLFLICILLMISSSFIWAAEIIDEPPFLPVSPRVLAQGGSFTAIANGYESLFYNPAGFANTRFSLTLASQSVTGYLNPAVLQQLLAVIESSQSGDEEAYGQLLGIVNNQITSGGFGANSSTGVGLVAGGLGLGGALTLDASLYGGRNMLDLSGNIIATLGFVAGYALDFNLLGMVWNVGAAVRPMYRVHSILNNKDAIDLAANLLSGENDLALEKLYQHAALTGLGVGIDLGAIVELGKLQLGLSVKDLFGTKFNYYVNSIQTVYDSVRQGEDIPQDENSKATDIYRIPMDISLGAGLTIDFLAPLLSLTVHGDLQDVIGVVKYGRTPWTLLHLGAEASLLKFIKVRAGFNQGYITLGAGVRLLILDVNVAAYTRELGKYIGDQPNSGLTAEIAIRL